jgi:hypothetical protein
MNRSKISCFFFLVAYMPHAVRCFVAADVFLLDELVLQSSD